MREHPEEARKIEEGSLGLLILLSLVCAAGGWGMLILTNGSVEQMENDIKIASKSVEEYQRLVDIRLANIKAENERLKAEEALKHPKCPMCGSTNTQIISTLNRAVSVGMVGLASSKIGKQYECKKCKHNGKTKTPSGKSILEGVRLFFVV